MPSRHFTQRAFEIVSRISADPPPPLHPRQLDLSVCLIYIIALIIKHTLCASGKTSLVELHFQIVDDNGLIKNAKEQGNESNKLFVKITCTGNNYRANSNSCTFYQKNLQPHTHCY